MTEKKILYSKDQIIQELLDLASHIYKNQHPFKNIITFPSRSHMIMNDLMEALEVVNGLFVTRSLFSASGSQGVFGRDVLDGGYTWLHILSKHKLHLSKASLLYLPTSQQKINTRALEQRLAHGARKGEVVCSDLCVVCSGQCKHKW